MRAVGRRHRALVALALLLAGCSSSGSGDTTSATSHDVGTSDSALAAAASARAAERHAQEVAQAAQAAEAQRQAELDAASTTRPVPVTTIPLSAAACTSDALLAAVSALFPDNDRWNPVGVDIAECQAGYARVFVVPDLSVCTSEAPDCLEHEQVFLHDNGGAWEYLDSGTGLSCQDPINAVPLVEACQALGLS